MKMRKSYIMLAIAILSLSMHSCTTSDINEDISIEEAATEGENSTIDEENDD